MEMFVTILLLFCSLFGDAFGAKTPPPVVDAESSSPTSITFQWKPPSTSNTITKWRIQYLEVGRAKRQQMIAGALTEYTLEGLKPETRYRVRMLAVSGKASGKPSSWLEVTTLTESAVVEEPPPPTPTIPEPPQNLAADATANTASITWDTPVENGAPVLGYIITYGPIDNPRENILSVDLNPRQASFDGLTSNVQYRVSLTAFNTNGQSTPARLDFFTAADEVAKGPPPQVENIQYENLSPTTLRITWTLPATTELNVIESIVFGYGDEGAKFKQLQKSTLEKGATSYTLEQLTPESRYTVMVRTINQYGQNPPVALTVETPAVPAAPATTAAPAPKATTTAPAPGATAAPAPGSKQATGPPPQLVNVQYQGLSDSTLEISWTLPATTAANDIEAIAVGFGAYGIPAQFLPVSELGRTAVRYVADDISPGSRYTAMVIARNRFGQSDPVIVTVDVPNEIGTDESSESSYAVDNEESEEVFYLQVPSDVNTEVLSTTSVRLYFNDPTIDTQSQVIIDDRYYTVRYKTQEAISFQYMHFRQTTDIIPNLLPETTYQFEVKVVKGINGHSLYSLPVYAHTRDPNHVDLVQDVTIVQLRVFDADRVLAIVNWLPPQNQPQQITGYVLEYTDERIITPNTTWEKVTISTPVPAGTLEQLATSTSYNLRVAPQMGVQIGEFSNPPEVFTTPSFSAGQPFDKCSGPDPTTEQIIARVNWMRDEGIDARQALLGVPLPYCDDYYARHECHGLVCFCVPGKRPASDPACAIGVQGDQPVPGSSSSTANPCRMEYEAALQSMKGARKAGKPLPDVHLPYCTDDGYYQPKQCLGSLCYCSTRDGQHTGKELPLWDADTLDCCKY